MINTIDEIHTFAERLLLGENVDLTQYTYKNELEYSLDHVHGILNSKDEYHEQYKYELRLRLAIHFSPIEAIKYDPYNDQTRLELISNHLQKYFNKNSNNANILSNTILDILDKWETKREPVTKYREQLLDKQKNKCNHCNVLFIKDDKTNNFKVNSQFKKDKYKPYLYTKKELTDGYIEYCSPEVDHIKPVSAMGDNNLNNLQVLCKLCNRAKSDILNVKTLDEIKYAAYSIDEILEEKPTHIHKMLYFTIQKANRKCEVCSKKKELTIRKIIEKGAFTRSNLRAVCKLCTNKMDSENKNAEY